jgi:Bacterial Ig domain/Domain of unknown function DUF11
MKSTQIRRRRARELQRALSALVATGIVATSLVIYGPVAAGSRDGAFAATPNGTCTTSPNIFNTGYDSATGGQLASGTDANWVVAGPFGTSTTSTGATYSDKASSTGWGIQPAPANATWGAANIITDATKPTPWYSSPFANAAWISQEPGSGATQAGPGASWYYKYDVTMDSEIAAGYKLELDFFADNSVAEVYVNGVPQSSTNATLPQGGLTANPLTYQGFSGGPPPIPENRTSITLAQGWQGGLNSIVVQIYSAPGQEGFLTQASSPATCAYTVEKSVDNPNPRVGDKVTYTVGVKNTGTVGLPYTTGGVSALVTDDLTGVLDDATFNNDQAGGGTFTYDASAKTLSWTGAIAAGATATLTYSVTAKAGGNGSLSNSVSAGTSYGSCASPCTVTSTVLNAVDALDDTATVDAGSTVNTAVNGNDGSATGAPLGAPMIAAAPAHGAATVQPDGSITYAPAANFSGADLYTYTVCDNSGTQVCDTATVNITVKNVFSIGTSATGATTPQNIPKDFPLSTIATTNGSALDPTTVTQITVPTRGSLALNPTSGNVTYTPNNGFSGTDYFVVRVCDASSPVQCSDRTVSLTVGANAVTPSNDTQTVIASKSVTTNVVDGDANGGVADTSVSGQALNKTTTISTTPSHGTATPNSNGTITYTPTAGYSGPDTYSYRVCDTSSPTAVCAIAAVAVTVRNGFITASGPGTSGSPASPSATGQAAATATPQNTHEDILLSALVQTTGKPLSPGSVAQGTAPAHGALTISPTTGNVTYTPIAGYSGPDSFAVQVCDTGSPADCYTVQQSITVGGNVVTANTDTPTVIAGTAVRTSVILGDPNGDPKGGKADTSVSGQPLNPAIAVATQPTRGTATPNGDGTITYTPSAGYTGLDTYQYVVCDTSATPVCATGTVNVTVRNGFITPGGPGTSGSPAAPNGTGLASSQTPQNTPLSNQLRELVLTKGKPLDATSVEQVTAPTHGALAIDLTTGALTYTPTAGYSGPDSYTIQVCDSGAPADCSYVQNKIIVGSNVVAPAEDTVNASSNESTDIDVLNNDITGTGQPLDPQSVTIARQPSHGAVARNANGTVTYTPNPGFTGTDSFDYRVCDTSTPTAVCSTSTVTLNVHAVTLAMTGQSVGIALIAGLGALVIGFVLLLLPRRLGGNRAHRAE